MTDEERQRDREEVTAQVDALLQYRFTGPLREHSAEPPDPSGRERLRVWVRRIRMRG